MGDQKTQQALEHVSKSHEKHVTGPTPSIKPAGPNDNQMLSRLSYAGSPPAVLGQGLSHPTASTHQATMLRTLQRRQGNAFVQRAVTQGHTSPSIPDHAVKQAQSDQSIGQALNSSVQADMEASFGQDFSEVRIHTDGRASDLAQGVHARAFTRGQDIYFGVGQYQPGTLQGKHLLAHELTHTVQQRQQHISAALSTRTAHEVSQQGDPLEREAEDFADLVATGREEQAPRVPMISSAPASQGVIARQPLAPSLTTVAAPGGSPTSSVQTQSMTMESSLNIEMQHTGELEIITAPRLVHERHIHIKTDSGAEADVTIKGTTELPTSVDSAIDPNTALRVPGEAEMGYTLFGTLADGIPISSMGILKGDNTSLANLASTGPEFLHFALTPEQQYQTIVDAMRHSVTEQVWKDAENKGHEQQKQKIQYPSQEDFGKMTPEEKRSLAKEKFEEEFSWTNVLKGVLIGLGAIILGVIAVAAGSIVALAVAIALAVYGLSQVILSTWHDVFERWEQGDIPGVLLELLKGVALVAGIILGAIALVLAFIAGGVEVLAGLAIAAIVALVVAAIIGIILVFMDLDKAGQAQNVEDFKQHVKRAAREAEEATINIILLIISFIMGAISKWLKGRKQGDSGEEKTSNESEKITVPEKDTSNQSETEQQQTSESQGQKDAYTIAKEGGKHSGWYEQYKVKDTSEIQRGIRSIERQIQEHQDKIANPKKYIEDFDKLPPQQQKALVEKKWPSDIQRQSEQKAILEGILKDRGEK